MSDTMYVKCARFIDATRNDPGSGDAREKAICAMTDLLVATKLLRAVIHDCMTHEQQKECEAYIWAADIAIARVEGGAQ